MELFRLSDDIGICSVCDVLGLWYEKGYGMCCGLAKCMSMKGHENLPLRSMLG